MMSVQMKPAQIKPGFGRGYSKKESIVKGGSGGAYVRPSGQFVYYEEDLASGKVIDVTDRYMVRETPRQTVRTVKAPVKTLTSNGSIISAEPSMITLPRQQEKIVTRVLPPTAQSQRIRRVVQSPMVMPQGSYRTVIDSSRGVIRNGSPQVVREVVAPRYVQQPQVVQQVVRRGVPSKKYYVTNSTDYSSSSDSSSDSDDKRTLISKGEVVHAVIRDNWTIRKDPKEEKKKFKAVKNGTADDDDASSSASSSSLESRKLKILEQVRDNGVENGQVIVNDNGTPVIVKMRGNKKEKKSKKGRKKEEDNGVGAMFHENQMMTKF